MPWWISPLELIVKGLVWWYGHPAITARLEKYTPLPPDITPAQSRNPNQTGHYGGL